MVCVLWVAEPGDLLTQCWSKPEVMTTNACSFFSFQYSAAVFVFSFAGMQCFLWAAEQLRYYGTVMAEIRTLTVTHVQSPWSLWQCWEGQWRTCVRKRPGKHWWTQLVATIVSHGRVKTIEWECLSFCKAHLNSASNEFSQGTSPKKLNISKPSVKMKVSLRFKFQYPTEENQFSYILEL